VPWRNGRGETLALLSRSLPGCDGFAWRLSIAVVDSDGPFSHFPGCDRTLLLLEGRGITLKHSTGQIDSLSTRFSAARFSGDHETIATLHDGPIRDFNVICHRKHCVAHVDVPDGNAPRDLLVDADTLLVYATDRSARVRTANEAWIEVDQHHLMQYDKPVKGRWSFSQGPAIVMQICSK